MYSVKQIAERFGISRRTLQYYDDLGILPASRGDNGYRFYSEASCSRLAKILVFKQAGLGLKQIEQLLEDDSMLKQMLAAQQAELDKQQQQLHQQQAFVEQLLSQISSQLSSKTSLQPLEQFMKNVIQPISESQREAYEAEAKTRWDTKVVESSNQRWKERSKAGQQKIIDEGNEIYRQLAQHIDTNQPSDDNVQALIKQWHAHIQHFYEPTSDMLLGLGDLYVQDERFKANFDRLDERLAEFIRQAVVHYVANLT